MLKSYCSISKIFQLFILVTLFQMVPSLTAPAFAGVVSGDFVYVQEGDGSLLQYHIHEVEYQGVPAWRISWNHEKLKAEHYVRRSDCMPMYVKRINHALKHTVEIIYSQNADIPSIYRMRSDNEYIERKIWDNGLRDLGALPQLLLGLGTEMCSEFHQARSHPVSIKVGLHLIHPDFCKWLVCKFPLKPGNLILARRDGL